MNQIQDFSEFQQFLSNNYIADSTGILRFNYSKECLEWACKPPNYIPELLIAYRDSNGDLLGTIVGIPIMLQNVVTISVNFLCVHLAHREKGVAKLLIDELMKRAKSHGFKNSVFTRGVPAGTPNSLRYHHYLIDVPYLVELGLFPATAKYKHPFKLDNKMSLRPVVKEDIPEIHKRYSSEKSISQKFTIEELEYWVLTRPGVVYSFVSDDYSNFASYFIIESTYGLKKGNFRGAYTFLNYSERSEFLTKELLISAKNEGCHQFNTLFPGKAADKLLLGTGSLVYFHNEKLVDPKDVYLVMV